MIAVGAALLQALRLSQRRHCDSDARVVTSSTSDNAAVTVSESAAAAPVHAGSRRRGGAATVTATVTVTAATEFRVRVTVTSPGDGGARPGPGPVPSPGRPGGPEFTCLLRLNLPGLAPTVTASVTDSEPGPAGPATVTGILSLRNITRMTNDDADRAVMNLNHSASDSDGPAWTRDSKNHHDSMITDVGFNCQSELPRNFVTAPRRASPGGARHESRSDFGGRSTRRDDNRAREGATRRPVTARTPAGPAAKGRRRLGGLRDVRAVAAANAAEPGRRRRLRFRPSRPGHGHGVSESEQPRGGCCRSGRGPPGQSRIQVTSPVDRRRVLPCQCFELLRSLNCGSLN